MIEPTANSHSCASLRRSGALVLLLAALFTSACVDTSTPRIAADPAPVDPAIEPVTGLAKDALVAVQGMPDLGGQQLYLILYYPSKIDPEALKAAPSRLCANRGMTLVSAEDKPLDHPDELPGVRKYVVRCQ